MSLSLYKKKRDFKQTTEPEGVKKLPKGELIFVVQKHAASRLHYDFRLELNGVLLSWAVPKGPSINPSDKRLAIRVEDHPFDYKDFEGVIQEGNYGAGEVIVWDNGYYNPMYDATVSKKNNEKLVKAMLKKGDLKIVLAGKKLKGAFALVKIKSEDDKSWLLIKKKDEYSNEDNILLKDKSIISKKTIEQIKNKDGIKSKKKPAKKKL